MKTVCAWCGKHLKGEPDDPETSHGICEICSAVENVKIDVSHEIGKVIAGIDTKISAIRRQVTKSENGRYEKILRARVEELDGTRIILERLTKRISRIRRDR